MAEVSGVLLVDKSGGTTSRRVAEALGRHFARPRRRRGDGSRFRVGHAGTLDPLATGLLVVLVGRATRLQPFLLGMDKTYSATVRLGVSTDSLDSDGEVIETMAVPADPGDLEALAAKFIGEVMQVPPLVSALKRGGRSLHALVRAGEQPEPPPARPVRIDSLVLTRGRWGDLPTADDQGSVPPDGRVYELELLVDCGSGTYVRSLARDLAETLGTVGHIVNLRRLRVGPFLVDGACHADADPDTVREALLPMTDALPHLPAVILTDEQCGQLRNGTQPDPAWVPQPVPEFYRLQAATGELVALGRRDPDTDLPALAVVFPASTEDEPCA